MQLHLIYLLSYVMGKNRKKRIFMRHLAWGLTQSPQKIAVKIITIETVCVS